MKGARRQLAQMKTSPATKAGKPADRKRLLFWLKKELLRIRGMLDSGN